MSASYRGVQNLVTTAAVAPVKAFLDAGRDRRLSPLIERRYKKNKK